MAFGQPLKAECQKKISPQCLSKNGEATLIYNKSRMACAYCNEHIKKGIKDQRKEQAAIIRKSTEDMLGKIDQKVLDQRFYRKVWNKSADWKGGNLCQECGKYLTSYSATYVSHIISRGAETRLRYDDRNVNILCYDHHRQWETGKRDEMRIFETNQTIINILKQELSCR